jgi:hypothetical protein
LQGELGYPAEALEPLQVAEAIPPLPRPALPPYNGYGTLDDSKQNCVALVPKPPKKVSAETGPSVHKPTGASQYLKWDQRRIQQRTCISILQ